MSVTSIPSNTLTEQSLKSLLNGFVMFADFILLTIFTVKIYMATPAGNFEMVGNYGKS